LTFHFSKKDAQILNQKLEFIQTHKNKGTLIMGKRAILCLMFSLSSFSPVFAAAPASAPAALSQTPSTSVSKEAPGSKAMGTTLSAVLLGILSVGLILGFGVTIAELKKAGWKLADALSEEASPSTTATANAVGGAPTVQTTKPDLAPSTSRLIAFLGLQASLTLFVGVGFVYIWRLANGVALPAPDDVLPIIYGGAVTFAPYAFNKASEAVSNLLPKK
jgi:hypothetical protein